MKNIMKNIKTTLFKPRLLCLAPKRSDEITLKPFQVVMRVLIALITAGWVSFLPLYLFIIYMIENSFFSYDFFVEGIFGLNTFIVATAMLFVFMSLYFYGFILFFKLGIQQLNEGKKNQFRLITWLFFIISILLHGTFFEISMENGKPNLIFWLMGISIMFCGFFYSFVGHGLKKSLQNWMSPILFIAMSILLPLLNPDVTSEVVSMGLKNFNMGGRINIQILDKKQKKKAELEEMKLLLLTPKNAYVENKDKQLMIVPISEHTELKIW